jgi:hypothetical protein
VTWLQEWKAIAARIDSLLQATTLYYQSPARAYGENYVISEADIIPACRAILKDLDAFSTAYETFIPAPAKSLLTQLLSRLRYRGRRPSDGLAHVESLVVPLGIFRAEFEFHLRDVSAVVRKLVVRAFTHLQRLLIVDHSFQKVWQQAFRKNEPACERLGAVHLLAHGIWAFKVSAAGEQTDLVLGTHLDNTKVEATAEGLVLTEWKRVLKPADTVEKVDEAVKQMRLYSKSSLASCELVTDRYVVLVSRDYLDMPNNFREDGIMYHHINVAVAPSVPSRISRRRREP